MKITSISETLALKAAKQLIGQWPNARADNATIYAGAIAAVLSGYPPQVVADCCDPRGGLARKREFPPTVACVVEWCDARLKYYRSEATMNVEMIERKRAEAELIAEPLTPEMAEKASTMLGRLAAWLKTPPADRGEAPQWQ